MATVVVIRGNELFVANVGDAAAFLCREGMEEGIVFDFGRFEQILTRKYFCRRPSRVNNDASRD